MPTQQAERSRLQRAGPPPATLAHALPPSQGPASRSAAPWQLHTRLWGCSWESLKPEHHGMTVDQLLWHHCVSEDYFLFRLFTLNHQEWTRAMPRQLTAVTPRVQAVSSGNRGEQRSRFPKRRADVCPGTSITVFSPFKEGNLPGFWEFRAQQWNMVLTNNIHDSQFFLRKYKISSIQSVITRVIEW